MMERSRETKCPVGVGATYGAGREEASLSRLSKSGRGSHVGLKHAFDLGLQRRPLRVGGLVDGDEVAQEQYCTDPGDLEQSPRQRVLLGVAGVQDTHRLFSRRL